MPTIILASAIIIFGHSGAAANKPVAAPTCHVETLSGGPAMGGKELRAAHPGTVKVCQF